MRVIRPSSRRSEGSVTASPYTTLGPRTAPRYTACEMIELADLGPELPAVARQAIAAWAAGSDRRATRPGAPAAPVFVTLRASDGKLRGCIGSLIAVERDVVAETARSAVLAASRDPRFLPVGAEELVTLS